MTTADKLSYLAGTKTAIKNAIEAKGVDCTDATFRDFAGKVAAISSSGGHDVVLGLDFLDSAVYGSGSNRTTGGGYNSIASFVYLKQDFMRLTKVYWDVLAGTYELRIDGNLVGEEIASGSGTIVLEFPVEIDLLWNDGSGPAGSHRFQLNKVGTAIQMRDGPLAANDAFTLPASSIYNSTSYNYQIPIKLEGMITERTAT